jgi:hypothetical protein
MRKWLVAGWMAGLLSAGWSVRAAAPEQDDWVRAMQGVHARFQGKPGTLAHFGDSITVSRAYWYGLKYERNSASPQMVEAYDVVARHMLPDCWDWRGPEYGN